jgi:hypothetical protein
LRYCWSVWNSMQWASVQMPFRFQTIGSLFEVVLTPRWGNCKCWLRFQNAMNSHCVFKSKICSVALFQSNIWYVACISIMVCSKSSELTIDMWPSWQVCCETWVRRCIIKQLKLYSSVGFAWTWNLIVCLSCVIQHLFAALNIIHQPGCETLPNSQFSDICVLITSLPFFLNFVMRKWLNTCFEWWKCATWSSINPMVVSVWL